MGIFLIYMASPAIVYFLMGLSTEKQVNEDEKLRKVYLVICGGLMAMMIGFRNKYVGSGDSAYYYRFWEYMSEKPLKGLTEVMDNFDLERGFQIFVWIFAQFFSNGQWVFVITGIVYAVSVCVFINKNCKNAVVALIIFNCLGLFNFMVQGMRQAMAMSICLFALEYYKGKKIIPFLACVGLACTFHMSAIVFSLVYFLKYFRLDTKSLLIFSVIVTAAFMLLPNIFSMMNDLLEDDYQLGTGSDSGGVVAIMISLSIIIFALFFPDRRDKYFPAFVYFTIISTLAMVLRNTASDIAVRIGFYFSFGQMVVVSNSIQSMKNDKDRIFMIMLTTVLCMGVAIHKASYSVLIPYTFYWQ